MKKKYIIIFGIVVTMFIGGLMIFYFIRWNNNYSNTINLNWNIELSKSYKEIYSQESESSFHGDGERYHIFEYENNDSLNSCADVDWKIKKDLSLEDDINSILKNLGVLDKYSPDFEKEYKYYFITDYKDFSKIYLIFIPELNKLYIIEQFI